MIPIRCLNINIQFFSFQLSVSIHKLACCQVIFNRVIRCKISPIGHIYRVLEGASIHTKMPLILPCLIFSVTEWSYQLNGNYLGLLKENFILYQWLNKFISYESIDCVQLCFKILLSWLLLSLLLYHALGVTLK